MSGGLFILCELLGLIFIILSIAYGSGIKESDAVDGPEISGFFLLGLICLIGPWIFIMSV